MPQVLFDFLSDKEGGRGLRPLKTLNLRKTGGGGDENNLRKGQKGLYSPFLFTDIHLPPFSSATQSTPHLKKCICVSCHLLHFKLIKVIYARQCFFIFPKFQNFI